ncbi:MAG: lysophospholipid acyltransferase family protein [Acidobacteriaceae bacterium]
MGEATARFALLRMWRGSRTDNRERAEWLHRSCRTILRGIEVQVECRGPLPSRGLVCSNHLGYLDIAVYAAAVPCVFVSKREVGNWPALGTLARWAGTIFLDRQSRASADAVAREMKELLREDVPVMLFPEGTSTDGSEVLRFHPTLIGPAVDMRQEIAAAAIGYRADGAEERELCWYGDAGFLPHLLRLLGRTGIVAEVEFYPEASVYPERKAAAQDLQEKVEAMRNRMRRREQPASGRS